MEVIILATEILCNNAEYKNSVLSLNCKVIDNLCAFQMYCPKKRRATNTNSAVNCKNFIKRGDI